MFSTESCHFKGVGDAAAGLFCEILQGTAGIIMSNKDTILLFQQFLNSILESSRFFFIQFRPDWMWGHHDFGK